MAVEPHADTEPGIQRAIRLAGSQKQLAQRLTDLADESPDQWSSASQQLVSWWAKRGYVPVERAEQVSHAVGGLVPPRELVAPKLREVAGT